jgi:fucose permease
MGALTGVALSTRIFSKVSAGKWMAWGYILLCIIMILEINAVNHFMLLLCLYCFGLVSFLNGVASNATVNILEKKYKRRMMSTCHGLYSLGGGVECRPGSIIFWHRHTIGLANCFNCNWYNHSYSSQP